MWQHESFPLTHPQKRIWYIEKIYPNTSLHNLGGFVKVLGKINFSLLENSINFFIQRNEGLRLRLFENQGEPRQYFTKYEMLKLDFFDFSASNNPVLVFNAWIDSKAQEPFILLGNRLFYFALFRIDKNSGGYLMKFHHIIADGWTTFLATSQIAEEYSKLFCHTTKANYNSFPSYLSYIHNEQDYLLSSRFERDKLFWCDKFNPFPETVLYNSSNNLCGKRKTFVLDIDLSNDIRSLLLKEKISFNSFFSTLLIIYLHRVYHQNDIVIGISVLNRVNKEFRQIVGMFTNSMPLRISIEATQNVHSLLRIINNEQKKCYLHQRYPYDLLVRDLELRQKGKETLFDIFVNYYNTKHTTNLGGMLVENNEFYNGAQNYSLQLVIKDWLDTGNLILSFDYKTGDYCDEEITRLYDILKLLSQEVLCHPDKKIHQLKLLPDRYVNELIYNFNNTTTNYPQNKLIHQLFEEQVEKTPDKIAVEFRERSLSYRELDNKSNQLACFLRNKNIGSGDTIGVLINHSFELIISMLGVLKAGGAYLPIDPTYPKERIQYLLKDSEAILLLTNEGNEQIFTNTCEVINLKTLHLQLYPRTNNICITKPENVAYMIYTSGSTGKPKAVIVKHKSLVNYIWWAKKIYVQTEQEVFALYSSVAFDLTVTSIFTPLISGNKIRIYCESGVNYVLYDVIQDNKVTILKLTPSHLTLLQDLNIRNSSIRCLIVGGEDFKVTLAKQIYKNFGGRIVIYNEYGPTEATVGCMIYRYNPEKDNGYSVPIGTPIDNVKIYVLDPYHNLLPKGFIGEIYVSGSCLAEGYFRQNALTAEKFIKNPFLPTELMYKTGDLGRLVSNRDILEYFGRVDSQVKIRGYRIELSEIESCLLTHPAVSNVVVVFKNNESQSGYLCAYLCVVKRVSRKSLRYFLLRFLPEYMIPLYFIFLDKIILTPNGKVDINLLPKPKTLRTMSRKYVYPKSDIDKKFMTIVEAVLDKKHLSMQDNFFYQGGDSIKAIQIVSKLNSFGLGIKVIDIMSNPMFSEMIKCIKRSNESNNITENTEQKELPIPAILLQFLSWQFSNMNYYNQSVLLELNLEIEYEILEKIIGIIINYHDALRLNYSAPTNRLFYNNDHLNKSAYVERVNLSSYSYEQAINAIKEIGENIKKTSFDISKSILFKCCLFSLPQRKQYLLLIAHHLVIDGVSWRILLEDLSTLTKQAINKQEMVLPSKTNSFALWTRKLHENIKDVSSQELSYWQFVVNNAFVFPTDFSFDFTQLGDCETIHMVLAEKETQLLLTTVNLPYKTTTEEIMIITLALVMRNIVRQNEVIFEVENHGRNFNLFNEIDVSRTIGWFTSIYPVRIKIEYGNLSENIKSIKEQLRSIPNRGINFSLLKYVSRAIKVEKNNKYIRFNYLGDFSSSLNSETFNLSNLDSGKDADMANYMTCLIDINAMIIDKKMQINCTYSKRVFHDVTIQQLLSSYVDTIKLIIKHCIGKKATEISPSDFTVRLSQTELNELFN